MMKALYSVCVPCALAHEGIQTLDRPNGISIKAMRSGAICAYRRRLRERITRSNRLSALYSVLLSLHTSHGYALNNEPGQNQIHQYHRENGKSDHGIHLTHIKL